MNLNFHHMGLAVANPERAIQFVRSLEYAVGEVVTDPEQNVNLIWCESSRMPAIEIIYPTDTPGPLEGYLKSSTELIYHLCYQTRDLDGTLQTLKAAGNRVLPVSPPKPALLFGGQKVSFYQIRGFGLIEILETPGGEEHAGS